MTTAQAVRHRQIWTNRIGVLTLVLIVFLIVWQLGFVNPENATTHSALCAYRADLQNRIATTQKFLAHPQSFPQFDDPKVIALIRTQEQGQERTVTALGVLSCG